MKQSTQRVLSLLRSAGSRGITTGELAEARCPRASARIYELRHVWDCEVEATRLCDNAYRFVLTHEPDGLPVGGAADPASPGRVAVAADPEIREPAPARPLRPVEQQLFDTVDLDIPPPRSPYGPEAA